MSSFRENICWTKFVLFIIGILTSVLILELYSTRLVPIASLKSPTFFHKGLSKAFFGKLRQSPAQLNNSDLPRDWTRLPTNDLASQTPKQVGHIQRNFTASDNPRWRPLDAHNAGIYTYAAYYDDVDSTPFVRVLVSMVLQEKKIPVMCVYFEHQDIYHPVGTTRGELTRFKLKKSRGGHGAFAKCPLLSSHPQPYAVSVVKLNDSAGPADHTIYSQHVTSVLQVHYSGRRGHTQQVGGSADRSGSVARWNIIKCFPALHRYKSTMQLIQQVEINRVLGVDHFFFYNLSAIGTVNTVLRYYQQNGLAEIFDWHYPRTMTPVVYYMQREAIQDCLHRGMHSADYLLFGDLDEITVPRPSTSSLPTLLNELFSEQPQCSAFRFLNTFFDQSSHSKLPSSFARTYGLNMLLTDQRVGEIWTDGRRAKPAVIPTRVELGDIHSVVPRTNYTACKVPPERGLLHHYRTVVPFNLGRGHRGGGWGSVTDHSLLNLSDLIVARVRHVLQTLNLLDTLKQG